MEKGLQILLHIYDGLLLLISSAFHLSYNMLLNQIRAADGDPENLLRNSFYQFQADRAIPDLEVSWYISSFELLVSYMRSSSNHMTLSLQKQVKLLEAERDSIIIEEEDSLENYYSLLKQYKTLKKEIRDTVFSPKNCLPFLQPGRLVSIQCTKNDESTPSFSTQDEVTWGVIINFERVKVASEGEMSLSYLWPLTFVSIQ